MLASDGTALLYHAKLKLWSMLPKCPYSMNGNVPLVNFDGKIVAACKKSGISFFDTPSSSWKEISGPQATEIIHMVVNCGTLYAYVKKQTQMMWHFHSLALFTLTTEGWKEQQLDVKELGSKLLLTSEHVFVETAKGIYRQNIRNTSESEAESDDKPNEPPKEIASPPYKAFTLHVLKDTLLSFGGHDEDNQPTSDVLRYNPDTDTWESAGYMRSARYNVAVATVQQDTTTEVYVLGGEFGSTKMKMTPKLHTSIEPTPTDKTPADWDCSTSIIEKCTLSD